MWLKKSLLLWLAVFTFYGDCRAEVIGHKITFGAMAPLYILPGDWEKFNKLLEEAKEIEVETISVDIWWGLVYKDRGHANWEYYDKLFPLIEGKNLHIAPILAIHKCGGGPGDNCLCPENPPPGQEDRCAIPLPDWIYYKVAGEAGYTREDMMYKSETGRVLDDALPPWLTETKESPVLAEIINFYTSFREHFAAYAARGSFSEIHISLGPTGELRYPSYNKSDGWQFPQPGHFQAYSQPAVESFKNWLADKYGNLEKGIVWDGVKNQEIQIPTYLSNRDSLHRSSSPWVEVNEKLSDNRGRDFIDWYVESLTAHGRRLLFAADGVFGGEYSAIPLSLKIPGVHWQLQCTPTPRMAEMAAGLVKNNYDFNSEGQSRNFDHGYAHLFRMISDTKKAIQKKHPERDLILYLTALEMDNDPGCKMLSPIHGTSRAESLVFWISDAARKWNVTLRGENALQWVGAPDNAWDEDRNWEYVKNALREGAYSGFSFLRLWDEEKWRFDKDSYAKVISELRTMKPRSEGNEDAKKMR